MRSELIVLENIYSKQWVCPDKSLLLAVFLLLFGFSASRFVRLPLGGGDERGLLQEVWARHREGVEGWTCWEAKGGLLIHCPISFTLSVLFFCVRYLIVLPGGRRCPASWPGRSGPAPLRCSWSDGPVWGGEQGCTSALRVDVRHTVTIRSFRAISCLFIGDSYCIVVGLGGWFSGEQSSVGEGRPSESSLSRGIWGHTQWERSRTNEKLTNKK